VFLGLVKEKQMTDPRL